MFFERYKKDDRPSTSPSLASRTEAAPTPFLPHSSIPVEQGELPTSFPDASSRTVMPDHPISMDEVRALSAFPPQPPTEQPLACLFYFFHSQMSQHTSTPPDSDLVRRRRQAPGVPVHQLDTHLNRLQMHAGFSEHVKRVQAFPVAVDPAVAALGRGKGGRSHRQAQQPFITGSYDDPRAPPGPAPPTALPRPDARGTNLNEQRDTVLLVQFRSKASREQWMESKEWREFYDKVSSEEGGCRRMPHVRCARSLRGLMDVGDVLTA